MLWSQCTLGHGLTFQLEHDNHLAGSLQLAPADLADYIHNMGQRRDWSCHTDRRIHNEALHSQEVCQTRVDGTDCARTLRRGQQRLLMHIGKEADPAWATTTPSEIPGVQDEMGRLEEVRSKERSYER